MDFSISVIVIAGFLGFAPAVFWFWFFRSRDKKNPEPNKLLVYLFLGGIASTIPAALLQLWSQKIIPEEYLLCFSTGCDINIGSNILTMLLYMFLIVAPTEELSKFFFAKWISFNSNSFDQIIDGIKYSIAVALGFASLENVLYLVNSLSIADFDTVASTLITRFFISTLAHTMYAGIMGYYIGRARFDSYNRNKLLRRGVILAIIAHGAFNFLLFTGLGIYSLILVGIIFFVLLQKFQSKELTAVRSVDKTAKEKEKEKDKMHPAELKISDMVEESQENTQSRERGLTITEFCPRCLKKNVHKSKYCPHCGEKLFMKM